jgi:hypothetical protein
MKRRRLNENALKGSIDNSTQVINSYLDFTMGYQGNTDYWKSKGFEEFVSCIDETLINLCLQATSGAIKRSFSAAQQATTGRKNRTGHSLLDSQLIVYLNRSFIENRLS